MAWKLHIGSKQGTWHDGHLLLVLLVLVLAACASRPPVARVALPPLRLAPVALGHALALQQQLRIEVGSRVRTLDALLEVDADEVRLVVLALGQPGARLFWDGATLRQERADWLPAMVRGERVLDDLQFAFWPAAAIRAALPPGWALEETGDVRRLQQEGRTWLEVRGVGSARLQVQNLAEGYRLDIDNSASGVP